MRYSYFRSNMQLVTIQKTLNIVYACFRTIDFNSKQFFGGRGGGLNRSRNMAQKNISLKNQQKTSQRNSAWSIVFVYVYDFFQLFLAEKFWSIQTNTHKSINIIISFSLRDLCKGDTKRFMMEKPRSTPVDDGGISNANFKTFILFRKLWTEPSEHT